jgi:hypothetical protein
VRRITASLPYLLSNDNNFDVSTFYVYPKMSKNFISVSYFLSLFMLLFASAKTATKVQPFF